MDDNGGKKVESSWVFRLILNLLGYATVVVPGLVLFLYVKKSKMLEKPDRSYLTIFLREMFFGPDKKEYISLDSTTISSPPRTLLQDAARLIFCSVGLLVSYLIWGLEQERIMTRKYTNSVGESGQFEDSQFLVFVNRILAVVLAALCITFLKQPRHTVPYYKYIYCSFSNVMSSWFQYEALKYISFPTQVISKTCKIIPVMIMGKIVSKRKYDNYEYVVAVLICVGMIMFLYGSPDATKDSRTVTTFSGVLLIIGYMAFDSFTSNWQSELFTKYSTSSLQMMCGVNFFSVLLTTVSLLQQDSFASSFAFTVKYPSFLLDCILLSVCSAVGQLFVYYTIACFGPVVFIIIMTIRQGTAIILSCITYHHFINIIGIMGIIIVFGAIFLRIYCSQRKKQMRSKIPGSVATA